MLISFRGRCFCSKYRPRIKLSVPALISVQFTKPHLTQIVCKQRKGQNMMIINTNIRLTKCYYGINAQ